MQSNVKWEVKSNEWADMEKLTDLLSLIDYLEQWNMMFGRKDMEGNEQRRKGNNCNGWSVSQ